MEHPDPDKEVTSAICIGDIRQNVEKGLPMAKDKATIADKITENWLTKRDFADELDVTVNNLNQILTIGPKLKKFPKPGPQYCQKIGTQNKYSPEYIALVQESRKEIKTRTGAGPVKRIKSPDLTEFTLPVYKNKIDLLRQFFSDEEIQKKLTGVLDDVYNTVQTKMNEVKQSIQL